MTAPMGTVPTWLMQNSFSAICPYGSLNAPITDFELDRINESPEAGMGRRSEMSGGLLPLLPNIAFTSLYRVTKEKYNDC